jgi:hypothetical protein
VIGISCLLDSLFFGTDVDVAAFGGPIVSLPHFPCSLLSFVTLLWFGFNLDFGTWTFQYRLYNSLLLK